MRRDAHPLLQTLDRPVHIAPDDSRQLSIHFGERQVSPAVLITIVQLQNRLHLGANLADCGQSLEHALLVAVAAVIDPQPEMALDRVRLRGDGALARVYALLEIRHLLRFRGLVADEIIDPGGAPQPLVIIATRGQRPFDDAHRLFVAGGVIAKGEEVIGLLILVRIGRSRGGFGLRLREDGRKETADDYGQKYRYFHRSKTNNTVNVSQVAAAGAAGAEVCQISAYR